MIVQKKTLLVLSGVTLLIALLMYLIFQLSKSRTFQFFENLTSKLDTKDKVIALTFDDAPSPQTRTVLEILTSKNVTATFYMVGQNIEKFPMEAKDIADAKMELGNHSYSHHRMIFKSLSFIDSEVQKTTSLIRKTGYTGEITFRPPNGKKLFLLPWYLQRHNIKTIMWDVEPDTYASSTQEGKDKTTFLINYVSNNTKPGSIILMHPFCDKCVSDRDALPIIIDTLQQRGYRFVTVSELLSLKQ
jgi:chitin deacetylase